MPFTSPHDKNPACTLSLAKDGKEYGLYLADELEHALDDQARIADTLLVTGGGEEFGGDPDVAQIQQKDWTGGGQQDDFANDDTKYYDGKDLWSLTEGKIHPSLQWKIATGLRNAEQNQPGDVSWQQLLDSTRYISVKFTPSSIYNLDKAYLWIRRRGTPGTLTLELHGDSAGQPDGVAVQSATVTTDDITDIISVFQAFDWSGTQTPATGADYHLVIYGASGDDAASHWEVGVDDSTSSGYQSSDGSSWVAASYQLYYRVTDTDTGLRYHPFVLETAQYVATEPDDGSAGKIYIIGDRGTAGHVTGANTSLQDTDQSWTTDEWANAYVRIFAGTGRGQIRKISSNTSNTLTVSTAWDIDPSTDSEYYIYKTNKLTEITGHGITRPITDVMVANNIAYFCQGASHNIQRMRWNGNASPPAHEFSSDGNNQADFLVVFGYYGQQYVFRAVNSTAILDRAIVQDWGTPLRFTDSGTAESGGTNYIQDTDKSWEVDEWKGGRVVLDGGTGDGQSMEILTNTVDTLIINGEWGTTPDNTTTYDVYKQEKVGQVGYDFTNFYAYQNSLMGFKENALYADCHTKPVKVDVDLDSLAIPSNGQAVTQSDFFLMYNWAFSVEQQFGTGVEENAQLSDIGPWKGTGLPGDRQGVVSVLRSVMDFVFAGIDGDTDNYSSVMVWNKRGWHEIFRAWEKGQRIRTLFWQSSPGTNPRLWIQAGTDLVYMDFPYRSHNPLNDSTINYMHESVMEASYIDMKRAAFAKYFRDLVGNTDNLSSTIDIGVDYQLDDDVGGSGYDNWTQAGSFNQSPEDIVQIKEGDARRIRPRLRLMTEDASTPPVVNATVIQGFARIPDRRMWAMVVEVENVFLDKEGRKRADPDEFLSWLYNKSNAADGVRMYSVFTHMNDIDVVVKPVYPTRVKYSPRTGKWRGRIRLILQEA